MKVALAVLPSPPHIACVRLQFETRMSRPRFLVPLTMTAFVAAATVAGGSWLLPRTLNSWTWLNVRNDPLAL
eukprot:gene65489-89577_t